MPYYNRPSPTWPSPPTLSGDNNCPCCGKFLPILTVTTMGRKHPVGTLYLACKPDHCWHFFPTVGGKKNCSPPRRRRRGVVIPTRNLPRNETTKLDLSRNCTILVDARNSSFISVEGDQHNHTNVADSSCPSSSASHNRRTTAYTSSAGSSSA